MRLFLCEARRQIRSIVSLCEEFGDRRSRAKRTHKNDFFILFVSLHCLIHLSLRIVGFEIFSFVVRLATSGKTDSNLRQASLIQKESQADNRQTLILQGALQLCKLLSPLWL